MCSNYSFNKNYRIIFLIVDIFIGFKGCLLNFCFVDGFFVFFFSFRSEEVDNFLRVKINFKRLFSIVCVGFLEIVVFNFNFFFFGLLIIIFLNFLGFNGFLISSFMF